MAVVRPARSAPPIALITFVFLFLVSTGLAIYFGLQMASAQEDALKATQARDSVVGSSEQALISKYVAAGAKQSALSSADKQLEALKAQVSVTGSSTPALELVASLKAANAKPLLEAYKTLSTVSAEQSKQIAALTAQMAAMKAQMAEISAPLQTTINSLKQELADKTAASLALQNKNSADDAAHRSALDQLLQENEKKISDDNKVIREAANQRQALEDRLEKVTKELADLKQPPIKNQELPILWEADGSIIRTTIGSDELYVNLGRKDRLRPNMTFTVYDPKLGVGSGNNARGKGAIEIMTVGETESLARVTHTEPGETILAKDLIANVVYNRDAHKVYKFYVFGDFDLDGDGISTPSERDKVIRMIQAWGGEVVTKIDSQTDFLILGTPPSGASNALSANGTSDQTADLDAQKKAQKDEYVKALITAKDFAIPVMDANRFFAYIGYYNNTIVGKKD